MVRRDITRLLEELLEAVPVNSTMPISTIALKAEMDSRQARKLIEMVIWIQEQPKVRKVVIGEAVGYNMDSHPQKKEERKQ